MLLAFDCCPISGWAHICCRLSMSNLQGQVCRDIYVAAHFALVRPWVMSDSALLNVRVSMAIGSAFQGSLMMRTAPCGHWCGTTTRRLSLLSYWPSVQRPRHQNRFVLMGHCWLNERSKSLSLYWLPSLDTRAHHLQSLPLLLCQGSPACCALLCSTWRGAKPGKSHFASPLHGHTLENLQGLSSPCPATDAYDEASWLSLRWPCPAHVAHVYMHMSGFADCPIQSAGLEGTGKGAQAFA